MAKRRLANYGGQVDAGRAKPARVELAEGPSGESRDGGSSSREGHVLKRARRAAVPINAFLDDPRTRIATIPIVLWVCAAVVAHLAGGGGAVEAAALVRERDELRAAVRAERASMRPADKTFDLELTDDTAPTPQPIEPPKDDPNDAKDKDDPADRDAVKDVDHVKPLPPKDAPKPEPKKEEPKKEEPKPEPPKPKPIPPPLRPVEPVPAAPAPPPPPPPPPEIDHRQAVKQVVKPNQEDNKTATRIADDANTVKEETMARARAQDQDSPKPSMGASKGGPRDDIGNSKDDHSGSTEDHKGDKDHAPGEAKPSATDAQHENPAPPVPPTPKPGQLPTVPGGGKGGAGQAPVPAAPPASPGGAGPASPEVIAGDKGTYTLDPANPGGDGRSKRPGRKRAPSPYELPIHADALGRGGSGFPGGPKVNLDQAGVVAAVGNEQLARERAADGEARRAAHRGKWEKNTFDKWRPAIENYEPTVKLDNTTALNAARSPFATYLVTIHNRIHPIFAEQYLDFYNSRPKDAKVNDMTIYASLEIVLDKATGKIVRMGVTHSSGITEYDMTALSAVSRAAPFGKAPDIIASPDGNVYLHWEFHRDPFDACTTRNARPFILKEAPKKAAVPVGPLRRPGPNTDDRSPPSGPLAPGQ